MSAPLEAFQALTEFESDYWGKAPANGSSVPQAGFEMTLRIRGEARGWFDRESVQSEPFAWEIDLAHAPDQTSHCVPTFEY
jgi:hypothetical protein